MPHDEAVLIPALHNIAIQLRIDSIRSTTEAGNGHPSSCCSAAEIMAALFFSEMRFDPFDPQRPDNDRFVMSKGHAAPILYAAWAEAGLFDRAELLKLRRIDSDLEGHPTPRLSFVDVATGSLGQGISAAVGIALYARQAKLDHRTYVLLGDGESAEGSVWESANLGERYHLDSLCGITDVNALAQSGPSIWGHDVDAFARRWTACGWHTIVVDGHNLPALLAAFDQARQTHGRPTMILARTIKGKGVSFIEGKDGWHGKPLKRGDELDRAIAELEAQVLRVPGSDSGSPNGAALVNRPPARAAAPLPGVSADDSSAVALAKADVPPPTYKLGDSVATREAYGAAIARLADGDVRIVALDADVKNSTFSDKFEQTHPDRFYQGFIAEQVMVGAAMGMASRGAIAFPSTFACFLTRAYDFIRMACISNLNVKLCGSHAGVSIGEDGPSQMGLEDLAMMCAQPNMTVLYPCDGVSTDRLVALAAYHPGPAYIRTSRPKTPVIYGADEKFAIGGSKVLRESEQDVATVVGVGVTVFEALKAYDRLKASGTMIRVIDAYSVHPIDSATLARAARQTQGRLITVEDHYVRGGLGDAVADAVAPEGFTVHRLAVREIPRSGKPDELLDRFGISATHIVAAVTSRVGSALPVGR